MKDHYDTGRIRALVRPDSVHRDVYLDPVLFELELKRIFARAWNYLCHESRLPRSGDYLTADIAGNPVIVIRGEDNLVRALHNRCAHRGAKVLDNRQGNAKVLTCSYHGWSYTTDGALLSIPCRDNYRGTEVDKNPAGYGLTGIRTDSYRGFIFASLDADAPDLAEYLAAPGAPWTIWSTVPRKVNWKRWGVLSAPAIATTGRFTWKTFTTACIR